MASAKGRQPCMWYCSQCRKANYASRYIKRRNDEIIKEKSKFCPQCRAHTMHRRKDVKKAAQ